MQTLKEQCPIRVCTVSRIRWFTSDKLSYQLEPGFFCGAGALLFGCCGNLEVGWFVFCGAVGVFANGFLSMVTSFRALNCLLLDKYLSRMPGITMSIKKYIMLV